MGRPVQGKKADGRSEPPCSDQPQTSLADAMREHDGLVKGTREGIEQFKQGRFVKLTRTGRLYNDTR